MCHEVILRDAGEDAAPQDEGVLLVVFSLFYFASRPCLLLRCASASMSITSPPCVTPGAGRNPDPVRAALAAIAAGADGITAHLREDRRHIRDDDMARLKAEISKPLNFEMAATADMLGAGAGDQAARGLPGAGTAGRTHHRGRPRRGRPAQRAAPFIARLNDAGIRVSLFIAADPRQIEMAAKLRAPVIEIHTGAWCDAVADGHAARAEAEWQRIVAGAGWPAPPGSRFMPATASIMPPRRRSRRLAARSSS